MVSFAKWTEITTRWIIYIISILIIYMLILKLTNHSPLFETIVAGGVGFLIVNTFKMENRFGKIENHMEVTKRTFGRIGHELDEIKKEVNGTKNEVKRIEIMLDERMKHVDRRMDHLEMRLDRIEQKLGA